LSAIMSNADLLFACKYFTNNGNNVNERKAFPNISLSFCMNFLLVNILPPGIYRGRHAGLPVLLAFIIN